MSDHISDLIYKALEHEAQANIDKAEATLEIYFNSPVGIGEHPQHLEEMSKLLDVISTNEDRLTVLKKYFSDYNEARGNV
jgi:transcriptional regulator|tara:strand:- start:165 stop:404 length:240 start_codon:yes stop_codon:yes gene_type:complete